MYQFTQQGLHFKQPNLLLSLSPAIQPQNQTTRPLTARSQHISVTTLLKASLSPPSSPHNTHSQPNSAHTCPLQTSQSTFPHWSILLRASNTSLTTPTQHRDSLARFLSTHSSLPTQKSHTRSPRQRHCLCPRQAPPLSTQPACSTELRILCLCLSQLRTSGGEGMQPCGLSRCQGPLPLATIS